MEFTPKCDVTFQVKNSKKSGEGGGYSGI